MPMVAACRRPTPRRPWRARQREVPNPRSPGRRAGPQDSAVQQRPRWTQGGRLVLQWSATCPPAPTPARTRPVEPVGRRTSRRRTTHEPVPAQRDPRRPGVGASPRAKARSRRPFRPSSAVRSPRFPLLGDRRPHRRALPGQCRPSRALPGKRHRLPARHRPSRVLPGKRHPPCPTPDGPRTPWEAPPAPCPAPDGPRTPWEVPTEPRTPWGVAPTPCPTPDGPRPPWELRRSVVEPVAARCADGTSTSTASIGSAAGAPP